VRAKVVEKFKEISSELQSEVVSEVVENMKVMGVEDPKEVICTLLKKQKLVRDI